MHVLGFITVSGLITTVSQFTNIKDAAASNKVRNACKSLQDQDLDAAAPAAVPLLVV